MSTNQQTPTNRSLIIIIAIIIIGAGWFVWQSTKDTDKVLDNTKKAQNSDKKTDTTKTDEYAGWKSYTWAEQGVTFKYPGDWFVEKSTSMDRVYVKNAQVDLSKDATPDNFQQIWLSADQDEAAQAREDAIKKGSSEFRTVDGPVTASTIKAGSVTITIYAYNTVGGPTVEAYWTNKAGTRMYATNSTEVGQQNQTDMVANLKKVLASITLQ